MKKISLVILLFLLAGLAGPVLAVTNPAPALPAPVSGLQAANTPNSGGGTATITWQLSANDPLSPGFIKGADKGVEVATYSVYRAEAETGPFVLAGEMASGLDSYADQGLANGKSYYYRVDAVSPNGAAPSMIAGPAVPKPSWFNDERVNMLAAVLLMSALVLFFIQHAKSGKEMFIRKIAGLNAVDEAIGRATEMGRPILYLPSGGFAAVSDIQTLASLVILGRVAMKTAEYETKLLVPCSDPLVMTLAQEIVKSSYMNAGRADAFRAEDIRYLTNEQFAYTAGVDGIMLREKPAANFLIGTFYAEALILAETGYATGAIQIAGTAMITQLPFFVAACDYTLIGEEIYAASAYLSKEPVLLGSIKGQDWGKAVVIALIIVGMVFETIALRYPQWHFLIGQWLSPR